MIHPDAVLAYLRSKGHAEAEIVHMRKLGETTGGDLKAYGYGKPLWVRYKTGGKGAPKIGDLVIRTMSPDPFGHDRHADRVGNLLLDFDTFNTLPKHIEAMDIGTFGADGALTPMARGEPFLITTYVDGALYADSLEALGDADVPGPNDLEKAVNLAHYLGEVHATKAAPHDYLRDLRDTIGSGEGIFGQTDAFAQDHPIATQERLLNIELAAVRWRWRLRQFTHRARRTHGDFHPFNILFRDDGDFSILDCSRGGVGEPADDVACLSINYMLFSLRCRGTFSGAFRTLWETFWQTYLDATGDREILAVVAPYFTWRVLVIANPVWYPQLSNDARHRLLRFCERLLDGEPFTPNNVNNLLVD